MNRMPFDPISFHAGRRQLLQWLSAAGALGVAAPSFAAGLTAAAPLREVPTAVPAVPTWLAACWERGDQFQVGVLGVDPLREIASFTVPTRAHGLCAEAGGSVLVVARRPGDWLLRWRPTANRDGDAPQAMPLLFWIEPQRAFNGHVVASADGRTLYTTETNLDTGDSCIGVRDARTMVKRDEWPTHGIDAHQLLWDRSKPEHLIVANGGVPTAPETGRAKLNLQRMDSSLVRIDARSGRLDGQWRLADPRLSMRHLAWSTDTSATLGIAMQSEHAGAEAKAAAPVLAVFDGERVRAVLPPPVSASPAGTSLVGASPVTPSLALPSLAGYGGDIAAHRDGFIVSCPRAQGVAHFSSRGDWRDFTPMADACALAAVPSASGDRLWVAGRSAVAAWPEAADAAGASVTTASVTTAWAATALVATGLPHRASTAPDISRLDNHWAAIATPATPNTSG